MSTIAPEKERILPPVIERGDVFVANKLQPAVEKPAPVTTETVRGEIELIVNQPEKPIDLEENPVTVEVLDIIKPALAPTISEAPTAKTLAVGERPEVMIAMNPRKSLFDRVLGTPESGKWLKTIKEKAANKPPVTSL